MGGLLDDIPTLEQRISDYKQMIKDFSLKGYTNRCVECAEFGFCWWIEENRRLTLVRHVLRDVLEQCWRLDEAGLDHGELSRAPKHIIMDLKSNSRILDFETASTSRKVSNVTSICNFLFIERCRHPLPEKRKLLSRFIYDIILGEC